MMRILIVIWFAVSALYVNGQDALFSQMMNNKNLLNPSLLSLQNSPLEISLSYREQAGGVSAGIPLSSFQAIANFSHSSREVDRMSYGVSVTSDKGGNGHLGTNIFHGHFAYLKQLTGSYSKIGAHYLSVGSSLGFGQRSFSNNRFWFGNQFDTDAYNIDTSLDSGEGDLLNGSGQSGLITDINVGLNYYAVLNDDWIVQAGTSVFHLDRSNISVLEGAVERNKMRYNTHFQISRTIYDNLSLQPQVIYMQQGSAFQLLFGSDVEIDNLDDNEFIMRLGLYSRLVNGLNTPAFESLIFTMNTTFNGLSFGFGYDFTISSMSAMNNGRGAWELNLGYAIPKKDRSGFTRKKARFVF